MLEKEKNMNDIRKRDYLNAINILFGGVSFIGNTYLSAIFLFTDYLDRTPDNTLIAPLITFLLGTGFKSVYAFAINALCSTPEETNARTNNVKHFMDLMTAFAFLAYITQVLTVPEFKPLTQAIGVSIIIALMFLFINSVKKIKENYQKND